MHASEIPPVATKDCELSAEVCVGCMLDYTHSIRWTLKRVVQLSMEEQRVAVLSFKIFQNNRWKMYAFCHYEFGWTCLACLSIGCHDCNEYYTCLWNSTSCWCWCEVWNVFSSSHVRECACKCQFGTNFWKHLDMDCGLKWLWLPQ